MLVRDRAEIAVEYLPAVPCRPSIIQHFLPKTSIRVPLNGHLGSSSRSRTLNGVFYW